MKIGPNCTLIASALSALYRKYDDGGFQPGATSLEHFLDDNGILLTMCMRYHGRVPWLECTRKEGDSKLSASWIQANKTRGFHVVDSPVDIGPPVGLILKPSATKVQCLYPVDAATDARDNHGCGPLARDPQYGSKGYDHVGWFGKQVYRQEIIAYKNAVFGKNHTWDSIPCSEFYQVPPNVSAISVLGFLKEEEETKQPQLQKKTSLQGSSNKKNNQHDAFSTQPKLQWKYQSLPQAVVEEWSYMMGHSVCNTSQPPPPPDLDNGDDAKKVLIYYDRYSWAAKDWPLVVQLMEDTMDRHPLVDTWNELVLQVPPQWDDFVAQTVQAVFCIQGRGLVADQVARFLAKREAKKMQKPVLYINDKHKEREEDVFHCLDDDDDDDDMDDAKIAAWVSSQPKLNAKDGSESPVTDWMPQRLRGNTSTQC